MNRYIKASFLAVLFGLIAFPIHLSIATGVEPEKHRTDNGVGKSAPKSSSGYSADFEKDVFIGGALEVGGGDAPGNTLTVSHKVRVGSGYIAQTPPDNGMIIEGKLGIGTARPNEQLEVTDRIFIGDGYDGSRTGLLIDGVESGNYVRLHPYDYGAGISMDLVISPFGGGNVGIGTTSPSKRLYVEGSAGGTQAWNASDKREKTEIEPIENALENILEIRGISYRWKRGDEEESQGFDDKTHFGVIAQEVEAVYPELVDNPGITEKRKHVEYNGLVGILIEAVKELKMTNDSQQAQIEELRSMINDFKSYHQQIAKR